MNVLIRKFVPNDVFGIRAVQHITWLQTYPNVEADISIEDIEEKFIHDQTPEGKHKIEEKKNRYDNPNTHTFVAEENSIIIGFCVARIEGNNGRIDAMYVLPKYQHLGLGRKLFKKALDTLKNTSSIYVNVVEYNNKAIAFYKKHGFIETGKKGLFDVAAMLPSGKTLPEIELIKIQNINTAK